jgi:hypothetical protein
MRGASSLWSSALIHDRSKKWMFEAEFAVHDGDWITGLGRLQGIGSDALETTTPLTTRVDETLSGVT